jgi:hypothetical protein
MPVRYTLCTTKLEKAIAKIVNLPEATQETIAEGLLVHLDAVEHLRGELQKGLNSIEGDDYEPLDTKEILRRGRATYDRG